jgi:hypothetical protein
MLWIETNHLDEHAASTFPKVSSATESEHMCAAVPACVLDIV